MSVPPGFHHPVGSSAGRRAASDDTPHAVFNHEIELPFAGAYDGLPGFHRQGLGTGHQGDFLQLITAIGNVGGDLVILAVVRKGPVVEGLENNLALVFEQVPVGRVIGGGAGRPQRLSLPRMVTPAHAEDYATAGQVIDSGEILGQSQGVPHGRDIKSATKLEVLGYVGQVEEEHQQVG